MECSFTFPNNKQLSDCEFTSFAALEVDEITANLELYDADELNERYQNFLNWLFKTMKVDENSFRQQLFRKLEIFDNIDILITSVGNGDDILSLVAMFPGVNLNIYAQDINESMCQFTLNRLKKSGIRIKELNISNISALPYKSNYFDLVFHFGGINWVTNKVEALSEMVRVCKDMGQIAIIDESVGPWLRNSEYGKMLIQNNHLWKAEVPLEILPYNINNVRLEYVLENCFYYLTFIKDMKFPNVDYDIKHIGSRGGSIRTRYFGILEGVDLNIKQAAKARAKVENMSEHEWLNKTIKNAINKP